MKYLDIIENKPFSVLCLLMFKPTIITIRRNSLFCYN